MQRRTGNQGLIFEKLKKCNEEIRHAMVGHHAPFVVPGGKRAQERICVLGSLD